MNPERVHELRPRLILVAIAVACVSVPYLTWQQTWFGRRLSQAEVGQYLADQKHPRKIQHALTFLGEQMAKNDPAARVWYPQIVQAARHPAVEIRTLAAWTDRQTGARRAVPGPRLSPVHCHVYPHSVARRPRADVAEAGRPYSAERREE